MSLKALLGRWLAFLQTDAAPSPPRHFQNVRTSWLLGSMTLLLLAVSCTGELGDSSGSGPNASADSATGVCVPDCEGRECGDDGCDGSCGSCDEGVACNPVAGTCADSCGDGVLDPGETCDPPGACVTECPDDDGDACTREVLLGTAESCSTQCSSEPVTECLDDDGCCAPGCDAVSDSDCDAVCGNGVAEPGETCGDGAGECPSECDDGDLCTEDVLVGSAETCDAACEYAEIDPCELDQARGVAVGDVTVDQGIRIPVREQGELIAPEEYNGPLILGRPMLVRVSWVLDDVESFVTRDIRALLTIEYPDGTSETYEQVKETGDRTEFTYDDFRDAYTFQIAGEHVKNGMSLSVELFETDESYRTQPPPEVPARFPPEPDSTFDLGLDSDPTHLEVVLVPIDHDLDPSCPDPPNFDSMTDRGGTEMPEHEYYRQRLMALNPVGDVTIIVHDVVPFYGSAESSSDIFTLLRQLREEDDAEDWQFYYGVIEPCDDGPGFSGVASVPNHGDDGLPDKRDGRRRTGWGDYRPDGRHAGTFVHEVGHEQGRHHVDCGGPSGPDPDYPNQTGDIEVYGWDIFGSDSIRQPDHKDYMSYCGPSWISEYGWNLMEPWIAEVSRWPNEQSFTTASPTPMLYATVQPGKKRVFWTGDVEGPAQLEPSTHQIRFYAGDVLVGTAVPEEEEVHKEPGAYFLAAPLPDGWERVTGLVHDDGNSEHWIPRSRIREVQ